MKKRKSHMKWSWILMVVFFLLGIIDIRFGVLGLLCMGVPLYHALKGEGKVHCAKYCPRGSFLGKFLNEISLNANLPKRMKTKKFKNLILSFMLVAFGISLYKAGMNFTNVAISVFRFMLISSIVAVIMGVFFKPRSWCQVCPMGHATGLIKNAQDSKVKNVKENKKAA